MAVPKSTATQAVDALIKWKKNQSDSSKPQLLPQDDFIYLIITLKKIPQKGGINGARTNPRKIPLPHPLLPPSASPELCLIIDDSRLTSEIAKKKIKAEGIPVTKVVKLSKLKTDYKPFESKRKLCDSYDMFFADKRVIPLLPKLLGKQFFKKKKLPLPVDLGHKNWKEQIERGCCSCLFFLKSGTCSVIRLAKSSMERDEIVENVSAAVDGVVEFVPKKWAGIRSLHLKFSESVALPLYQTLPDIKLRIEGIKETNMEGDGGGEIVVKDGDMGKQRRSKKARIHEVNHDADENEGEGIENLDLGNTELVDKKRKGESDEEKRGAKVLGGLGKKKRVKKQKDEVDNLENDDLGSDELVDRKIKGESKEKKPAKKSGGDLGKKKRVKKQKGGEDELDGENIENNDLGSAELVVRKRKGELKEKKSREKRGVKDDGGFGKMEMNGDDAERKDLDPKTGEKRVKKQKIRSGKKEKKMGKWVSRD